MSILFQAWLYERFGLSWILLQTLTYVHLNRSHHDHPRPASCRQRGIQQPQSVRGLWSMPSSELTCNRRGSWPHLCAPWDLTDTTLTRSFQSLEKYLHVSNPSRGGIISCVNHPRKSDPGYRKFPRMAFWEQTQSLLRKPCCLHKRTATQHSSKLFPLQDWCHQVGWWHLLDSLLLSPWSTWALSSRSFPFE